MANLRRLISQSLELREELEALRKRVLRQNELLSTKVAEHPGRHLKIVIPKGHRELLMLSALSQYLPRQVRVEVEDFVNRASTSQDELASLIRLVDNLSGIYQNDRLLFGRILPEMVKTVKNIRVFLSAPRSPKKRNRPRGYRDHGSMHPVSETARREADSVGYILEEQEEQAKEPSALDWYWDATLILEAERRGISTARIQELLAQEGVRHRDLTQYLEHKLDEDPTEPVGLSAEVTPSSSTGSRLREMRFD